MLLLELLTNVTVQSRAPQTPGSRGLMYSRAKYSDITKKKEPDLYNAAIVDLREIRKYTDKMDLHYQRVAEKYNIDALKLKSRFKSASKNK